MEGYIERSNHLNATIHLHVSDFLEAEILLYVTNVDQRERWIFVLDAAEAVSFRLPIPLPPGNLFTVNCSLLRRWPQPTKGEKLSELCPRIGHKVVDFVRLVFRTELTINEIQWLFDKTLAFMSRPVRTPRSSFVPCGYFYRDKPKEYFDEIFYNRGGVMTVYTKNRNGDPASPINGQIDGLFFNVNVDLASGLPIVPSLYGSMRLNIASWFMFQEAPNLYFCDFYCHFRSHHVTLVMTKPGSRADKFCSPRLLRLDSSRNPFLYIDDKSQMVYVTTRVWVQVLYAKNIELDYIQRNAFGFFKRVQSKPVPATAVEGIPKRPTCQICNVSRDLQPIISRKRSLSFSEGRTSPPSKRRSSAF